jgi:HlyD family secretion protein
VLKVVNGILEKRSITAGVIWNDRREILTGLNNGDVVVVKAGAFFADGDRIMPVDAAPAATDSLP